LPLPREHVPFIIPNKQIYIPDLGLDLREYFKQQRITKKFFSPAAQVVILFALLKGKRERLIPSELATELGYSLMTMTRAFNELEAAGIHKIITKGKERWWIVEEARDLWEQTKDMLRSPIRRIESMKLFPKGKTPNLLSGLSALAETTMINPPGIPIFAMGVEQYTQIGKGLQLSPADEAELVLEIWNYNPNLLSAHGRVDPFSLYLSLRDTTDERIEAALEELMEKVKW
jgi:DNA-binding MarR family transcriptional regulator